MSEYVGASGEDLLAFLRVQTLDELSREVAIGVLIPLTCLRGADKKVHVKFIIKVWSLIGHCQRNADSKPQLSRMRVITY